MTKKDYLYQKFASIGLTLTEADIFDIKVANVDDVLTQADQEEIYKAFIGFIPSILLKPTSVSEGNTSISRASKEDIVSFYSAECKRLGIKNEMPVKKPKVRFL